LGKYKEKGPQQGNAVQPSSDQLIGVVFPDKGVEFVDQYTVVIVHLFVYVFGVH